MRYGLIVILALISLLVVGIDPAAREEGRIMA
jgi:hypothetical protein